MHKDVKTLKLINSRPQNIDSVDINVPRITGNGIRIKGFEDY